MKPQEGRTMSMRLSAIFAASALTFLVSSSASALDAGLQDKAAKLIDAQLAKIVSAPEIIAAIKAHNAKTADYTPAKIDELDKQWRAQVSAPARPLIDDIAKHPTSALLVAAKKAANGLIDEVFVMDAKGLNVAMSDVTSDYMQGDEAKWKETFAKGPDARHFSELDFDDSAQAYVVQVSFTIKDPQGGAPIGAVTFGINADLLGKM
jgi:hypothetical protein